MASHAQVGVIRRYRNDDLASKNLLMPTCSTTILVQHREQLMLGAPCVLDKGAG